MVLLVVAFVLLGCARTWEYTRLESLQISENVPLAIRCRNCHEEAYQAWQKNRHGDAEKMAIVPVHGLRECEACHENTAEHLKDPEHYAPKDLTSLSKTEQNTLCGKCHYNQELFGKWAINPHDRHSLLMNAGFEGREKQLSCLDCHSGHSGKSEMLVKSKSHICFKCHKVAMVTMGVFQPFNYLSFGKACQACHAVHGGSGAAQWTRMSVGFCVVCHFAGVALVD